MGGGDGRIPRDELDQLRSLDLRGCGAALVGGLLKALLGRNVEPHLSHRACGLLVDSSGAVSGVRIETLDGPCDVHSRGGVIIEAHSRPGLERAAKYGDLWLSDPQRDIDTVAVLA